MSAVQECAQSLFEKLTAPGHPGKVVYVISLGGSINEEESSTIPESFGFGPKYADATLRDAVIFLRSGGVVFVTEKVVRPLILGARGKQYPAQVQVTVELR